MNRKTICKVLEKKHKDFIASIENEDIRKLVDKNSIITGGAIASMLLNEPIADFDYYFTDHDTCLQVAQYFVDEFKKLHPDGCSPVVVNEDGRVKVTIPHGGVPGDQYLAEQSDEPGDRYTEEILGKVDEGNVAETAEGKKYHPIFMTGNAITLSHHVQLVTRFYGAPEEIHKNYDFSHCTNFWTSKDKELVLNPAALESLLTKNLFYQGSLYPICSVIRTRKFLKRGWHINAGQYLKMCMQISELNLRDTKTLADQLTGVDAAYFFQVVAYCEQRQAEDPDFKITTPYLISIIDKIF